MFRLHCGRAGSGKTSALFGQILAGAKGRRRQVLVVPEMLSHEMERRLLKACGNSVSQYAEVLTFKRLATRIMKESGKKIELLDGGGRVLAMYRAVREAETALSYYKTATARPEMIEKLVSLTDELKACRIAPGDLLKVCAKQTENSTQNSKIGQKLGDIALIFAAYCKVTAEIGLDDKDLLSAAAENLRRLELFADYDFYFDGFIGFTAQEFELASILLSRCNNMEVAILMEHGDVIFNDQEKFAERLHELAKRYGSEFEEKIYEKSAGDGAILHIEKNLFGYGEAEFLGDCDCVKIYEAETPQEECAIAAAKIRQLVAGGARYRDISVAAGNMEDYAPVIEMQFAKYEVPVFLAEKSDILAKPVMAALVGALTAVSQNMNYDSVFTYLKSGLSVLAADEIDLLENYVLTWNVRGADYFKEFTKNPFGFDLSQEEQGKILLPEIERIRRKLAEPLQKLGEKLKDCACGKDYAAALGEFLEQTELHEKIDAKISALEKNGRKREAAEYAQLFDILSGCLGQFSAAMAEVAIDTAEFLRLWRLMLAQYDVAAIPVALDSVQAGDFERLSFANTQHLIVIGAVDGTLPPVGKSSGLLTEHERAMLADAGLELTQTAEEHAYEKQSQIYRGFASAQKEIIVTFSQRDFGGGKNRQSYLLRRLCAILPKVKIERTERSYMLTAKQPSLELACVSLAENGEIYGDTARQIALEVPENAEFFSKLRSYSASPRGPIKSQDLIAAAYGKSVHMTASRAEKIASCRFSYFMQYGLRAKERKIAKFGAPETGTMLHAVVESAISELSEGKETDPKIAANKFMDEYIASALSGLQFQSARVIALFKRMRRMVVAIVADVWQEIEKSKFKPITFEMTFGKDAENGAICIESGDMTLELVGQIDRVDGYVADGTLFIKVADYKTGQKNFRICDILAGINMQMFIYLLLLRGGDNNLVKKAEDKFGEKIENTETAGVLYIPAKTPFVNIEYGESNVGIEIKKRLAVRRIGLVIDDRKILDAMETGGDFKFLPVGIKKDGGLTAYSSVAGKKQFEQLVRKTDSILKKIARDISKGDIEAEPIMTAPQQSVCQFCAFKDACHFDETMKKDKFKRMKRVSDAEVFAILDKEEAQYGR